MASTDEEIQEVYLTDIARQTNYVRNKFGMKAFLQGCRGFKIEKIFSSPKGDGESVVDISSGGK